MQRAPLQELPLSRVPLPPTPQTVTRSNKRPLPPDGTVIFSPAKRRILSEDGITVSGKTLKSPFNIRDAVSFRASEETAESSPAKKLDFTAGKVGHGPAKGDRHSKPSSIAPSPQLPRTPHTPVSTPNGRPTPPAIDDFFATPERLPSAHTKNPLRLIPRPLPECSDPHSAHYPGFRVHRDPHITLFDPLDDESFVVKGAKENLPPRRTLKKAVTEPVRSDNKALLLTPESKKRELEKILKAKSTPATPKKTAGKERLDHGSPTPQRTVMSFGVHPWMGTPPLTETDKRQRRLLMMEEVEVGCDEDAFGDL
ncbi:hypothetical protein AAF712_005340 [Marasmius tenuissimus]|uniref:Uncharacterized protein n=1 Tax=Marasmius tenuissimus TaxID=585030 RepID=A0ABR3A2A6_9AGAR